MMIELKAYVGEDGNIVLQTPVNLPPGEVTIVISYLTDEEKADEALWDEQFNNTPTAVFDKLIAQGLEDYKDGKTDAFDPFEEDD